MPRQLRLEYPGAIYHVMNRGDRREPIFKDGFDRQRFLSTLGEACEKTGWQVKAILEDGLAAVAAIHDVRDGSGIFEAQLTGHGLDIPAPALCVNVED